MGTLATCRHIRGTAPQPQAAWSFGGDLMRPVILCPLVPTLILMSALHPASGAETKAGKLWVYVGTYTGGPSKGIYRCDFDPATGKLTPPALAAETASPS